MSRTIPTKAAVLSLPSPHRLKRLRLDARVQANRRGNASGLLHAVSGSVLLQPVRMIAAIISLHQGFCSSEPDFRIESLAKPLIISAVKGEAYICRIQLSHFICK
jgi:hypothetical protein